MSVEKSGSFAIGGTTHIHRMGYGAMRLCGAYSAGWCKDRTAPERVLRRAIELGIDFVDTADSYGPHINEEQIAAALHPYPPSLTIATKGSTIRTLGDPARRDYDNSPAYLRGAVEGSLRRLKLERIPLYQIHRFDGRTPMADCLGALADMQREGKIAHIGLSEIDLPILQAAQAITPIATVQNLFNLGNRQHQPVLDWCATQGIGFIPWFPLGGGGATTEVAQRIADRHGASPAQVALAWLLAKSPVMLLIPGTASVAHLEQNVAACDLSLSDEDIAALEAGV